MGTVERFGPLPVQQNNVHELTGSFEDAADAVDEAATTAKAGWEDVSDAITAAVQERPYISLAVAAGLGFLFALVRR
jgi:ElaB/YqjD/DUF883 family membrane-anchored ribosome-binding protein